MLPFNCGSWTIGSRKPCLSASEKPAISEPVLRLTSSRIQLSIRSKETNFSGAAETFYLALFAWILAFQELLLDTLLIYFQSLFIWIRHYLEENFIFLITFVSFYQKSFTHKKSVDIFTENNSVKIIELFKVKVFLFL